MRVGLLECDHDYRAMFAALLPGFELWPYDVIGGEVPVSPRDCDAWLATGSRHSVYEPLDWIEPASAFVRDVADAGVPFVGICFGHQLLAHALGGTVERAASGWGVGVRSLEAMGGGPWMQPSRSRVQLHFMHQDQVTTVPDDAVVLGCTDHCEVGMLRVGDRMLGIQAHPEFTVPYAESLLAKRVVRIGPELVEDARRSFANPTDENVVGQWIARFCHMGSWA